MARLTSSEDSQCTESSTPPFFDVAFVALGLILRDSHADKGSYDATDCATGERAHDGASGDERPDAWDGESADTG